MNPPKMKGLGRGLDALLAANNTPESQRQDTLSVGALQPGKYQPRTRMDPGSLEELAASIKSQGLIQPISVRPVGKDRYEIIAGERRWRAAQIAGLTEVPVLIRDIPDDAALAMSLIENIQREDLNPLEEAAGIQRLIDEFEGEATANYVYPIDNRDDRRAITMPPGELADASTPRDFYREGDAIHGVTVSPMIADRDFVLKARFEWQPGDEGVIVAMGDHFAGMVLFVLDGALHFTYQLWYRPTELAPIPLSPGEQVFELDYRALGARKGEGRITLNGQVVVPAADLSPTMVRLPSGGLSVGINRRRAISDRYASRSPFRYSARIDGVRIEPGPQAADTPMVLDEAEVQARMRAAAKAGPG